MNRMQRTCLAITASVASVLGAATAHAQVASQIPSSAQLVVRVKNLQAVSGKVSTFIKDIGVSDQVPPEIAADPLGALLTQGHITQGLNKESDAAVVIMDLNKMNGAAPAMLVLIPVSDFDTFMKNFPNAKADGSVTDFSFENDTTPSFAAKWGNYAAISPNKEMVATAPTPMSAPGAAMTAEMEKDVLIWGNIKALREMVLPQLDGLQQMATEQVEQATGPTTAVAKYNGVAKVGVTQMFRIAKGFMQQCDSGGISFNLDDTGLSIGALAEFQADSYFGKMIAQSPKSDTSLLAGLPDAKYMFVGGMVSDPKLNSQLISDAVDPIKAELVTNGDAKAVNDYVQAVEDMIGATRGNAAGWIVPTADLGAGPLMQVVGVMKGDAKTITDAQHRAFEASKGLMDASGNAMVKQTFSAGAKTVDGVSLDQMHTAIDSAAASTPQQQQAAAMSTYMYGPDGLNTYTGQVNEQTVVAAGGASDELLGQAIAAAKSDSTAVSQQAGIAATSAHLAKGRYAEAYLPLDTVLNTIGGYVGKMGIPINITIPATDPIGMALHADGSTLVGETYIPTKLVAGVVSATKQVMPKATTAEPTPPPAMTPPAGGGL